MGETRQSKYRTSSVTSKTANFTSCTSTHQFIDCTTNEDNFTCVTAFTENMSKYNACNETENNETNNDQTLKPEKENKLLKTLEYPSIKVEKPLNTDTYTAENTGFTMFNCCNGIQSTTLADTTNFNRVIIINFFSYNTNLKKLKRNKMMY